MNKYHCPRCRSTDVEWEEFKFAGFRPQFHEVRIECMDCGRVWVEDHALRQWGDAS